VNQLREFYSFFGSVKFASVQLVLSPPFPIPGAAYPLADVATPLRRAMLPSHRANTSSLPLLYLSAMLHPIASPLELKPKH
jgi:hypothetical protein